MIRLARRILLDVSSGKRDLAPDSRYDADTRLLVPGPHTMAIADCLNRWALMWAADMREAHAKGIELDQESEWKRCSDEANAEIDRCMANNNLTRAA